MPRPDMATKTTTTMSSAPTTTPAMMPVLPFEEDGAGPIEVWGRACGSFPLEGVLRRGVGGSCDGGGGAVGAASTRCEGACARQFAQKLWPETESALPASKSVSRIRSPQTWQ